MNDARNNVIDYYDAHLAGKLRDFVEGNDRVERAWKTIDRWAPEKPENILEIGCGTGAISWRMSKRWPDAKVVGADISPKSLEVAEKLFAAANLSFCGWPFEKDSFDRKFDLIVLMDVYEHITVEERTTLHEALRCLRSASGRIVLSFPTPRHLARLREFQPEQIQPVDEDIDLAIISTLARDTATTVILYQQVGVWHEADYAHLVLASWEGWAQVPLDHEVVQSSPNTISQSHERLVPTRAVRLAMVQQSLGRQFYLDDSGNKPEIDNDEYVNPVGKISTLDTFIVRHSILTALKSHLEKFTGTLLDIGCGHMPYKRLVLAPPSRVEKYVGLDLEDNTYQKPDLKWDGKIIPLDGGSVDCALATEVFEHCPEPSTVMREVLRILRPGGSLFFTVPFLWPLHDAPNDEYRYTPFALERLLRDAGFIEINLRALGGWDASLAQLIGLWVRRRPMSARKQAILSRIALPVVGFLLKRDRVPEKFGSNCMITGLSGTAKKPLV